jgi:DNA-binding response OmpR family regulator
MSSDPNRGGSGSIIVKCSGCGKAYRIHPEKLPTGVTSFPCRACSNLIPVSPGRSDIHQGDPAGRVLIVLEEEELGNLILRILGKSGFEGRQATSGVKALDLLRGDSFHIALLSVYLPDMMGYEFIDKLREEDGLNVPVILLSSIHHATRYKRAPTSLYGADDYLERHHLPDLLIPKIRRLLLPDSDSQPPVTPGDVPPPTDEQVRARRDLEEVEKTDHSSEDPRMGEIQRMCRVIAGDIALYNEDLISTTEPGGLLEAISGDILEGESLLMTRFPEMEDQITQLLRGEIVRLLNTRGIEIP